MSRKGIKSKANKRPKLEIRYTDHPADVNRSITKFINVLMKDGKKSIAFKIFYDAIDIIEERKQDDEKSALEIWKELDIYHSIDNVLT